MRTLLDAQLTSILETQIKNPEAYKNINRVQFTGKQVKDLINLALSITDNDTEESETWFTSEGAATYCAKMRTTKYKGTYFLIVCGKNTFIARPSDNGTLYLREGEYLIHTYKNGLQTDK